MRLCSDCCPQQTWHHGSQIKAAIEPVGELCKITMAIFDMIDRVIRSIDGRLQIAQDSVDPAKLRTLHRLASRAHDMTLMGCCGLRDRPKAPQAIRDHMRCRSQAVGSPLLDRFIGKPRHRRQAHEARVPIGTGLHRRDKRRLVLRAPATLGPASARPGRHRQSPHARPNGAPLHAPAWFAATCASSAKPSCSSPPTGASIPGS